jgi:hypothetical protein
VAQGEGLSSKPPYLKEKKKNQGLFSMKS